MPTEVTSCVNDISYHAPVPLKANWTVSPVLDVFIAVPLEYSDALVSSAVVTGDQLPVYLSTGLGESSV